MNLTVNGGKYNTVKSNRSVTQLLCMKTLAHIQKYTVHVSI